MKVVFDPLSGQLLLLPVVTTAVTDSIDTEAGDYLVTEAGDYLVPEA